MKHIRILSAYVLRTFCVCSASIILVSPFFVLAPDAYAIETGLDAAAKKGGFFTGDKPPLKAPEAIVGSLIGTALTFVGIIFLILMIYGGFVWMTAHGAEEKIGSAKKIIGSAVIGLVIIFAAYAITAFVTGTFGTAFGVT